MAWMAAAGMALASLSVSAAVPTMAPLLTPAPTADTAVSPQAQATVRAAMAKLFRDEPDVRQVIKLRSIYELLEAITDRCEDVANLVEGIVLENS